MARSLFWKEKVAISALVVFLFCIQPAISQPAHPPSITYSCRNAPLESVIEFLSRSSRYHFIYSRDMIDVTRQVSLTVSNKALEDVLKLIGKQAGVSFKVQDRHIIVKANPKAAPLVVATQPVTPRTFVSPPAFKAADGPLISSASKNIPLTPSISTKSILENRLQRRIDELQEMLGPNVPRDIPRMYVNRINFNTRHIGWFASVGTVVNDYSSGLELQGGVRPLYGIVHPRWSARQGFYGIYGIGNSFTLMRNFSFSTIYMYSGNKQSNTFYPYSLPGAQASPEFQLTRTTRHHQVKFALQYAMSRNVTFRLGPVLNYKTTVTELLPVAVNPIYEGTFTYRLPGTQASQVIYQGGQFTSNTFRRTQSWLGWEGAVSYRINFSNRR